MIKYTTFAILLIGSSASAQEISIGNIEQDDTSVRFTVSTDIAPPFDVIAGIKLADQDEGADHVGSTSMVRITGSEQVVESEKATANSLLPGGEYEALVTFYGTWPQNQAPVETQEISTDIYASKRFQLDAATSLAVDADSDVVEEAPEETQGGLTASQRSAIALSVRMFDELKECMAKGDFERFGFGRGGQCHEWLERLEVAQGQQRVIDIISTGNDCFVYDAKNYADTFYQTHRDMQMRRMVETSFENCRNAL